MEKILITMVTLTIVGTVLTPAYSVERWEKGLKLYGWYSDDPYSRAISWKSGYDANLVRKNTFSSWSNLIRIEYGEVTPYDYKETQDIDESKNKIITPNNGLFTTNYVRNITKFIFWNYYLSGYSRLDSDTLYYEIWITYGEAFNRFFKAEIGPKISGTTSNMDTWLRISMHYHRTIGYRTLFEWKLAYNNNLKFTNNYRIESEWIFNYRFARRFSLQINISRITQSDWDDIFKKQTIDIVFDLLSSGGKTY